MLPIRKFNLNFIYALNGIVMMIFAFIIGACFESIFRYGNAWIIMSFVSMRENIFILLFISAFAIGYSIINYFIIKEFNGLIFINRIIIYITTQVLEGFILFIIMPK